MKAHRTLDRIQLDMTIAEARALLEELVDVPGGTKLPKLRQTCRVLDDAIALQLAPHQEGGGAVVPLRPLPGGGGRGVRSRGGLP